MTESFFEITYLGLADLLKLVRIEIERDKNFLETFIVVFDARVDLKIFEKNVILDGAPFWLATDVIQKDYNIM